MLLQPICDPKGKREEHDWAAFLPLLVQIDGLKNLGYSMLMAVPTALLQQLLELGESERVEIAHALLASVDEKDAMSDANREKLHAAINRSLDEVETGTTVPFDDVIAALRAKRVSRATR